MRRRQFLAGSAALLASTRTFGEPAQAQAAAIVIDAHCHLFNVRDMPLEGFIRKVLIPNNKELAGYFARYQGAFEVMIHTLAEVMREDAPLPPDEIALLDDIARGHRRSPTADERRRRDLAILEKVLNRIWSKQILRRMRFRDGEAANIAIQRLQMLLLQEVSPRIFDGIVHEDEIESVIASTNLADLAAALHAEGDEKTIARNLHWALLFTRYRFELADELQQRHRGRAVLLAPALVDLAKWVEDDTPAAMRNQVEAMARVSLRAKGPRVHGFVGFDPLRQAIFEKEGGSTEDDPFAVVKHAIEKNGFVGVKLYPPMGFRPANNRDLGEEFPDHVKRAVGAAPGAQFDQILDRLYAWCSENNVAVLAHATNSNAAGSGYGKRADPKFWAAVLREHPRLRLSMAHFGGFLEKGDPANLSNTWEWTVGEIFKGAPDGYAYADLSYFSEIFGNADARRATLNDLIAFRITFPNAADHLLYGTDWTMVGREQGFHGKQPYAQVVVQFLHEAGCTDAEVEKIVFKNAVRLFGLGPDQREKGTRGRLERFYAENKASAEWLKAFG